MDKNDHKERLTIAHYNNNAEAFWQGTKEHDVSQNIQAFLNALPQHKALDILDFGCGPGRDLKHFKSLGHRPIGLDGSKEFCSMASAYSKCQTLQQNFSQLDLPANAFDGVFANASLFHVPRTALAKVLESLQRCLRPAGILFTSNPRGNAEGWSGQRYGHYFELQASQQFLQQAGFEILHHYYRPAGKPLEQQPWLAIISRKQAIEQLP